MVKFVNREPNLEEYGIERIWMRWWHGDDFTLKNLVYRLQQDFVEKRAPLQALIFSKHLETFRDAISKASMQISNQGKLITALLRSQKKREKEIERLRKRNWEIKSEIVERAKKMSQDIQDSTIVNLNQDLKVKNKDVQLLKKKIQKKKEMLGKLSLELEYEKKANKANLLKLEDFKSYETRIEKSQKRGDIYKENFLKISKKYMNLKSYNNLLLSKIKSHDSPTDSPPLDVSHSSSDANHTVRISRKHDASTSRSFTKVSNEQTSNARILYDRGHTRNGESIVYQNRTSLLPQRQNQKPSSDSLQSQRHSTNPDRDKHLDLDHES